MIAWNFQKIVGTCQFRVPWFGYPCGYSSLTYNIPITVDTRILLFILALTSNIFTLYFFTIPHPFVIFCRFLSNFKFLLIFSSRPIRSCIPHRTKKAPAIFMTKRFLFHYFTLPDIVYGICIV